MRARAHRRLAGIPLVVMGVAALTLAGAGGASAQPVLGVAASIEAGTLGIPITVDCFDDGGVPMTSAAAMIDTNLGDASGTALDPSAVVTVQIISMTPAAPGGPATGATTLWIYSAFSPDPGQTLLVDVTCNGITAGSEFPTMSSTSTLISVVAAPEDPEDPEDPQDPSDPDDPDDPQDPVDPDEPSEPRGDDPVTVDVGGDAPVGANQELAYTGARDVDPVVAVGGVALVAAGTTLLLVRRRRAASES